MKFEFNKIYKRSEIHDVYGGNRQSGISNCQAVPIIFIFSGKSGQLYGYQDRWDENNYFNYTGEGQIGDMSFTKGNLALRDHITNNKEVHLFEFVQKGFWKYIDQLELVDYAEFNTPDINGSFRKGIKFRFKSFTEKSKNNKGQFRIAQNENIPNETERTGLITSRVGQGWYRQNLIKKWGGRCAVTGFDRIELLIASHIVPWKDASDFERLDVENGILLSPNVDALFDRHLISFQDDGNIIIDDSLTDNDLKLLNIKRNMKLSHVSSGMVKYLSKHRKKIQKND